MSTSLNYVLSYSSGESDIAKKLKAYLFMTNAVRVTQGGMGGAPKGAHLHRLSIKSAN